MSIPFKYIIICLLSWLRKNRVQSNLVSVICLHAKGKLEVAVAVEYIGFVSGSRVYIYIYIYIEYMDFYFEIIE